MNARIIRVVLLSVTLIFNISGIAAAQDAAAAPKSPYVTVSGQALAWSAPWSFVDDDAMQTRKLDLVFLTDGTATVAVSTGELFPENARGLVIGFLGGDTDLVDVLDAGAGATTSYWFDQFPVDGEPFGAFSTATSVGPEVSVLVMYIGPVASFGEGMASAQAAITLDGAALFPNVDGMALQAQLEAAAPVDDGSGFEPTGRWEDPAYGVTVEWAEGWISLGTREENTFMLGSAQTMASVNITAMDRNGTTPAMWAAQLGTAPVEVAPESVALDPYVGQANAIGVIIDGEMIIVQEVLFLDDGQTVVLVSMGGIAPLMPPAINALRANVRIDGRTLLDGWETIAPELEIYQGN